LRRFFRFSPLGDAEADCEGCGIGGHSHESSTAIDSNRALARIEIIARMLILKIVN